jgi:hypothetical protein
MHHTPVQAPDAKGSHPHSCNNFQFPLREHIQPEYLHVWQDLHSLAFIQMHCLSFCQPSIFTSYWEF